METLQRELKKFAQGSDVKQVQTALARWGYRVPADGRYSADTQAAVRNFQQHHMLLPTGIVDQQTWGALSTERGKFHPKPPNFELRRDAPSLFSLLTSIDPGLYALALAAKLQPALANQVSQPAGVLRLSHKGHEFIYRIEARKGTSKHLHHPPGASGVTLGAGYDMKERRETEVIADLTAVGVDLAVAMKAAKGVGLSGDDAMTFAKTHEKLITLTVAQQKQLLRNKAPDYERYVRRHVRIDLFQWEYDALVSFVYNPGASFVIVARAINAGKVDEAMRIIKHRTGSGSAVAGLANRRAREIALYLYGDYHGA